MFDIRLYILGRSPRYLAAAEKLSEFLHSELDGDFSLEVIDLFKEPQRALEDNVFATPTVVKRSPAPVKKMIGDVGNREMVLKLLDKNS